jgi:phenylalanine-4-hydroxylase
MNSEVSASLPPAGAAADWTVPQAHERYTRAEHETWTLLYERQRALLAGRACDAFLDGLNKLDLHGRGIPLFDQLNLRLMALTGWQVVAVPGLVPDAVFFDHLAHRRFPAGNFIRGIDQLNYLQEPDVFHDVFGHVPMLSEPVFADYMQAYGQGGQRAMQLGRLHNLARLYWYTVEFGLMHTPRGLRIYGAGIVSSHSESIYSLEDARPRREPFELERVMRTPYKIDDLQSRYYVVDSLQQLRAVTQGQDFGPIYARLAQLPDHVL